MRPILYAGVAALWGLTGTAIPVRGETPAELVSTAVVWDQAPRNMSADLVQFKDRLFLVCDENSGQYAQDNALRVLSSADGSKWEPVTLLKSPTPGKGLSQPRFTVTSEGRLMIVATGFVPTPNVPDPVPKYGGTMKSMAWSSKDGRAWGDVDLIGPQNFPFSRVVWHKDVAYSYAVGTICGIMQTVQIHGRPAGEPFRDLDERTFSGFFPEDGALLFDGDTGYCLMSRTGEGGWQRGMLGTSRAPYRRWEWKDLETRISPPNLLRLPDNRVLAAVGLFDGKARTSLCEFTPSTGKFTEWLVLPAAGQGTGPGLALHDGHVWVSFDAVQAGKPVVSVAKVKLK